MHVLFTHTMFNHQFATISLPPSACHRQLATISQSRLTLPCHQCLELLILCLVAPNALDMRKEHPIAIYMVHCHWMKVAVCN